MSDNDSGQRAAREFWRQTLKWTMIFACLMVLLFGALAWKVAQINQTFRQKGVATTGTVTHAECNGSGNCANVQVDYQAKGQTRTLVTHTDNLKPVVPGQRLPVRYLRVQPDKAQLVNQGNDETFFLFMTGLMAALALGSWIVRTVIF